ncbi:MAG: alpha/beta hydrolase fold domain-containing protein, partial [SAR86 cluster bacterium]|nr:alpha/beta hydrolase fold domain-containing protein [SAR86 cluster bacterium]
MTKLILKIFFILPVWFLKLITLKKRILVNGQILDYQTQILLALQSLEANLLNLTEPAESIREKLDGRKDALPSMKLPGSQVTFRDHKLTIDNIDLILREYTPDNKINDSSILYFHGGGYVIGTIETHHQWVRLLASS